MTDISVSLMNNAENHGPLNEPVKVASCLDLPHAELARMALASEGIPAALGNANFVLWFWHYSNAVHGVTIHVRRRDAEQARRVLGAARRKITDMLPPWICASCGQRVAGQWDACWQCGHWADGTPSSPPDEEIAARPEGAVAWWNAPRIATLTISAVLIGLFLRYGPIPPLVLAPFVIFFVALLWRFEPAPGAQPEPASPAGPSEASSQKPSGTRSRLSRAIVRRAWQSAVLAAFYFFPLGPLGFCSMRLLWKLSRRNTPLGRADKWRCRTAFVLDLATTLCCLALVGALLGALLQIGR